MRTSLSCVRGSLEGHPPQPGLDQAVEAGGFRVRVYAGFDRVSGRRLYRDETVPPGPRAAKEAEQLRTKLLRQMDEKRTPRTRATVDQLLDRYLSVLDVEPTTRKSCEGYIRNHIRPVLGALPLAKLESETIDSFYARLRACPRPPTTEQAARICTEAWRTRTGGCSSGWR